MFDFRLRVFYTVAKRLNFTKAAEELFITQPAVTKHIQEIEHYFKIKLFDRNGTKIKLTPAGEVLLQYAEQLMGIYNNLEFELNTFTQQQSGRIRIGASTTVAQYVLPAVLAAFHKKFRDIKVTLSINNTEQIERDLLDNNISLGIIEGHTKNKSFRYIDFIKDELVLVARKDHPLAKRNGVRPDELLKIPLLLREPGSGTLQVLAHALKPLGIKISQLQIEMQLGSTEAMKRYLLKSDALAFLSIHSIAEEIRHNECGIIEVKGLNIERSFRFIVPHGQAEGLPDLFIQFARRYNHRL